MSETRRNQERIYEKERLVLWTTEEIATAMQEEGMDSADLAAATGLPKASVTRIMSGSLALTLPRLASELSRTHRPAPRRSKCKGKCSVVSR